MLMLCLALLPHFTLYVLSHPGLTFYVFLGKNLRPAAAAKEADKGKHHQVAAAESALP